MLVLLLWAFAAPLAAGGAHVYCALTLTAVDAFQPDMPAQGAVLSLDGAILGQSPCLVRGLYEEGAGHRLEARDGGWEPAARGLALPAQGEARIAVASGKAGRVGTLTGLGVGLALAAAALVAYPHDAAAGATLLGSGLAAVGLGQWVAWGAHRSALARAESLNAAWAGERP